MKKTCQSDKTQKPFWISTWTAGSSQNQKCKVGNNDVVSDGVTPRPRGGSNLGTVLKPKSLNFARSCCEAEKSLLPKVTPVGLKTRDKFQSPSPSPRISAVITTPKVKSTKNKENSVKNPRNLTARRQNGQSSKLLGQEIKNVVPEEHSSKESEKFDQVPILNSEFCHSPPGNVFLEDEVMKQDGFEIRMDLIEDQSQSQRIVDLIEKNLELEKENVELKSKSEEKDFLLKEYRKTFATFRTQFADLESEIRRTPGIEDEQKKIQLGKVRKMKDLYDQIPNKLEWRTPKNKSSDDEF